MRLRIRSEIGWYHEAFSSLYKEHVSLCRGWKKLFLFHKSYKKEAEGLKVTMKVTDEAQQEQQLRGADVLIQSLKQQGVNLIFGYPGGAVLPIYDALHKNPIRHVLARHEQGAIHAAEGYARVSGKTGVVIATSGPGATNLVTGIADAMLDSLPLVVITGQVASSVIGTDAFQEADIVGITQPITKHNYQVKDLQNLPRIIKEAFYIASTGRPGPVVIDITERYFSRGIRNKRSGG